MARRVNITIPSDIERDVLALIRERGDDPDQFGVFGKAMIDYVRLLRRQMPFVHSAPAPVNAVQPIAADDDDFGFAKE